MLKTTLEEIALRLGMHLPVPVVVMEKTNIEDPGLVIFLDLNKIQDTNRYYVQKVMEAVADGTGIAEVDDSHSFSWCGGWADSNVSLDPLCTGVPIAIYAAVTIFVENKANPDPDP